VTTEERIARPDFDAIISDDKNRELIEEFESESKTRTLGGWWGRTVTILSVATTLFALYYAAAGATLPFTDFGLHAERAGRRPDRHRPRRST